MENRSNKGMSQKKKIIFIILACVLLLLIAVGIFFATRIIGGSPENSGLTGLQGEVISSQDEIEDSNVGTETEVDPEASIAPQEIKDNIINVLLLGIDAEYKPYASDGGDRHTDAVMVVAINLDKNKVDLISVPRDTFTYVPDIKGIYKMNAAVNTGGGISAADGAGFEKTCESVSWLLGGIPIDYYYAVDFNALVELVNDIGGVDFNVDMAYQGQSGNVYSKGKQHLNGDGVMDYMRARKNATVNGTDKGRVDRQKNMLVAIFKKLKEKNMLSKMPNIIASISKGLYTNTNSEQTLSLANYATKIDPDSIGTHSLTGAMNISMGGWAFCYTDQDNRVELIKSIYGIEVAKHTNTSYKYAVWLFEQGGMTAMKYLNAADAVAKSMLKTSGGTGSMSESQKADYDKLLAEMEKVDEIFKKAGQSRSAEDNAALKSAMAKLKTLTESTASSYNYTGKLTWTVPTDKSWCVDKLINEVTVDFN